MEIPRFVTVRTIDHNGFCGRDPHPTDDHIGLTVAVRSILVYHDWDPQFGDVSYVVLRCETPSGSLYEFMDFEVEPVTETPEWARHPHQYDPTDEVDQ